MTPMTYADLVEEVRALKVRLLETERTIEGLSFQVEVAHTELELLALSIGSDYRKGLPGGVGAEMKALVDQATLLREQGMSYRQIADALNNQGKFNPSGKRWYSASLYQFLSRFNKGET